MNKRPKDADNSDKSEVHQTNASDQPKGWFNEEEYWPFVIGVMIVSGLIITPVIYSNISGLEDKKPIQLIALGVMYSGLFCIAHTRNGRISIPRLLLGLAALSYAAVSTWINNPYSAVELVIPGLLPLAAMYLGGWIGITLWRAGRTNVSSHPPSLHDPHDGKEIHHENGSHESESVVAESNSTIVIDKADLYNFLYSSYSLWKTGILDAFDGSFKTYASKKPLEKLTNGVLNKDLWLEFLEFCFSLRVTEAGEFMVGMEYQNFLLTNKYLYIYESKKLDKMHVIDLCEIETYKCEKKILTSTLVLNLSNQTEITCKLFQLPSGEAIKFLQELNDCTKLLEVEYLVD